MIPIEEQEEKPQWTLKKPPIKPLSLEVDITEEADIAPQPLPQNLSNIPPVEQPDQKPTWTLKKPGQPLTHEKRGMPLVSERGLLKDIGAGVKETGGFLEAPIQIASGIPSYLAGLIGQAATGLYDIWKSGGRDIAGPKELAATLGARKDVKEAIAALGTYKPKTQLGGTLSEVALSPIALTMKGLDEGVKLISDDPDTQEGIKFLGEVLLLKMLPKIATTMKRWGIAAEGTAFEKSIKKQLTKELGREVTLSSERILSMPYPTGPLAMHAEGKAILTPEGVSGIVKQIKSLKPFGRQQKQMYGKEFGTRIKAGTAVAREIGGMAGFKAKLAKMSGEYEKVVPDFAALERVLSEEMRDAAINTIEFNPWLLEGETLSAGVGFGKLLKGKLPQPKELELLQTVFGGDFVAAIMKKRPLLDRAWSMGLELANVPRSIMAGFFDLSFGEGKEYSVPPETIGNLAKHGLNSLKCSEARGHIKL